MNCQEYFTNFYLNKGNLVIIKIKQCVSAIPTNILYITNLVTFNLQIKQTHTSFPQNFEESV